MEMNVTRFVGVDENQQLITIFPTIKLKKSMVWCSSEARSQCQQAINYLVDVFFRRCFGNELNWPFHTIDSNEFIVTTWMIVIIWDSIAPTRNAKLYKFTSWIECSILFDEVKIWQLAFSTTMTATWRQCQLYKQFTYYFILSGAISYTVL